MVALGLPWLAGCGSDVEAPHLGFPARAPDAPGGARLAEILAPLGMEAREERIVREILAGNVPDRLRALHPVRIERELDGHTYRATVWVTADYLAIGSDDDDVLVPLSPYAAQRVADAVHASLPTPALVDAVWLSADARLAPQRLAPRDSVQSVRTFAFFQRHADVIRGQRQLMGIEPDALVAGHKKDVVIAGVLADDPGKVAVYGMHLPDGEPTQPLSTVAPADWVYYNHGVRLVHRRAIIDGAAMDLTVALADSVLSRIFSASGPLPEPRYPTRPDSTDVASPLRAS